MLHKDLRQLEKTKAKPETEGATGVGEEGGEAEPHKIRLLHLHAIPQTNLEWVEVRSRLVQEILQQEM